MENFNILDFIDSKDIREYNKDTKFNAFDMAILIYRCSSKSIYVKLDAYKYLIDNYKEEDFIYNNLRYVHQSTFKEIVMRTVNLTKYALSERYNCNEYVYMVYFNDINDNWECGRFIFDNYDDAYNYLIETKKEHDEYIKNVKTYAHIEKIKLNNTDYSDVETFYFNTDMILYDIRFSNVRGNDDLDILHTNHEFFINAPFKIGDIVRCEQTTGRTYYGVIDHVKDNKENVYNSFNISLCVYDNEKFAYTDNTSILDLTLCPVDKIPENQRKLIILSEAILSGSAHLYSFLTCVTDM